MWSSGMKTITLYRCNPICACSHISFYIIPVAPPMLCRPELADLAGLTMTPDPTLTHHPSLLQHPAVGLERSTTMTSSSNVISLKVGELEPSVNLSGQFIRGFDSILRPGPLRHIDTVLTFAFHSSSIKILKFDLI